MLYVSNVTRFDLNAADNADSVALVDWDAVAGQPVETSSMPWLFH